MILLIYTVKQTQKYCYPLNIGKAHNITWLLLQVSWVAFLEVAEAKTEMKLSYSPDLC